MPEQREVDVRVIERADILICDDVREVLEETGDLIEARKSGSGVQDRTFSMHALMTGQLDSRLTRARAPMFKSVGGGLQYI